MSRQMNCERLLITAVADVIQAVKKYEGSGLPDIADDEELDEIVNEIDKQMLLLADAKKRLRKIQKTAIKFIEEGKPRQEVPEGALPVYKTQTCRKQNRRIVCVP